MTTHPTHVPLSSLSIDDKVNARKTGRGSEPMYVASIRAKGIIEPLTVRQNGKGYTITNGGKRFASLAWLRDHHETAAGVVVDDSFPVPVTVRKESDAEARDTSLITNIVRSGMHPVDEYEAFVALEKDGSTVEDIAARYGLEVKSVRQRLALGKLSPKIRQAWRDGVIKGNVAMAFTLAPSQKDQDRVYDKLSKSTWGLSDHEVRQNFAPAKNRDLGKLIAFVGVEELQKAGVKITEDLFGADHRASDPKKVTAMAAEKLEAECQKLVAQGWAWALPEDDPEVREHRYSFGTLPHRNLKPTPAEKARLDELEKLEQSDDYEWTEGQPEPWELRDELEAAIRARAYKPAEMASAGCIVSIGNDGGLRVDWGKIKPAQKRKVAAQQKKAEKKKEAKAKGLPEDHAIMSRALSDRLGETLTRATEQALSRQPELALAAILAGFASRGEGPINVEERGLAYSKTFGRGLPSEDFHKAFERFSKQPVAANLSALAAVAGASLNLHVMEGGEQEILLNAIDGKALNSATRDKFDAADYFGSMAASACTKAIDESINADEARKAGKLKKKELTAFCVENVPKTGWLPPELRTAHYDGPGAKAPAKPKARKKPARKAAKR